ncbi:NIPSNAP family protein [Sphingomonas qomolangmaensis]|uniref:NIPSNAP family protein n=1 Tax=Sphingomonas qomolangmaensis TaxID=2918765 RepID=A0ABY5L7S6_9SPHN|nr:NIPSNAP family protein [Sphingomonas qomolangmaensis]UUL82492.1 NIPSNAP family protein [Sphingomonas qomolangmaensis]
MMAYPIDRRSVLAGAAAAGGVTLTSTGARAQRRAAAVTPEVYELRTYRLVHGGMKARLDAYLRDAFIPAARRAGCGPIGAFTVAIGPGSPSVHVLVPYPSIADFAALPGKLADDQGYAKAAEPFSSATPEGPPYASLDVKLMRAFPHFPRVEVPDAAGANKPRIFELRTYFSHSDKAGATKIEMFDTGGEIEIFRRNGLTPVFFAQDLTGSRLPSLTYLLTFPDFAARERSWSSFGADPAWRRLITTPGLTDPEITTGIDNQILSPTPYSQI